jgi:hypothetical protein
MRYLLLALPLFVLSPRAYAPPAPPAKAGVKTVKLPGGVVLEIGPKARRVIVPAKVVLTKGVLEGLLTRTKKKEHEYILATDADARVIHVALEGAGAEAGSPVKFQPRFAAPKGTTIKVSLRYKDGGKVVTVPAGAWVRDAKSRKALDKDWVFAGSVQGPHPDDDAKPRTYYMANHGDVIALCNMETAMLDLPVKSPKAINDRLYEAAPGKVPAKGTAVEVILEPAAKK